MDVVHSSQLPWTSATSRGPFESLRKELGGVRLGCGLWQLPPGKRSFPLHRHFGTEEALFVVSGTAKVRTEEGETPIGPGDFLSFPPGGVAHQLVNEGTEPLVYVAMSVPLGLDLVEYPDSGKVSCSTGVWPNLKRRIFKESTQVDYWDGEG